MLSQAGAPDAPPEQRETENEGLKRELEVLKPELQLIKAEVICGALVSCCLLSVSPASPSSSSLPQAQRCVTELKAQVNRLEAEVEEQRTHKQMAVVENEHLRMEVESLRSATVAGVGAQIGMKEADSECKDLPVPRGSTGVKPPSSCHWRLQREPSRRSSASLS